MNRLWCPNPLGMPSSKPDFLSIEVTQCFLKIYQYVDLYDVLIIFWKAQKKKILKQNELLKSLTQVEKGIANYSI